MNAYNDFNTSGMTSEDKEILSNFLNRRERLDLYIQANELKLATCPCCAYPTLVDRGGFEICGICTWEDDGQDDEFADKVLGGPNSNLSLTEARLVFGRELEGIGNRISRRLISSPEDILRALEKRDEVIKLFVSEEKLHRIEKGDPIWSEYDALKKSTLELLFEDNQ